MKVLFYSTKEFEREWLLKANKGVHEIKFTTETLSQATADLAKGFSCISIFTGDDASENVLTTLNQYGVHFIAIRAAGYDNVDINAADQFFIQVSNVPAYSPYAVAEHAVALLLALNRKIVKASEQVRMHNFLVDELVGFDLNGKTIGIIGTGRIGSVFAKIMHGFGCRLLAYDIIQNAELKERFDVRYMPLDAICHLSDVVSIHTPLTSETKYMVNKDFLKQMKRGAILINTARGAIINTNDIIEFLARKQLGGYAADVYEKEKGVFFYDHQYTGFKDELLDRLLQLPNVLLTPHQAFATNEALYNIAVTTFQTINSWQKGERSEYELTATRQQSTLLQNQL